MEMKPSRPLSLEDFWVSSHQVVHCPLACTAIRVLTLKQRQHQGNHTFYPSHLIVNFCRSLNIKVAATRTAPPTIYLYIHTHSDDESGWRWHCYEANRVRGVHAEPLPTPPHPLDCRREGEGGGLGWGAGWGARVTNGWD